MNEDQHVSQPPAAAVGPATGLLGRPDGRVLSWRASGPVDAPSLLWLHGSTGSARTAPVVPGIRVLSYDRPGYAASSFHAGRDLASDAEDIAALLDLLGVNTTRVLAFSGGAAIAYAAVALLPGRFRHLGVVSGAAWPTAPCPPDEALRSAAAALQADPVTAVDRLAHDAPDRDRLVLGDPSLRQELVAGARDATVAGVDGWIHEARLLRTDWPVQAGQVDVPVFMWHGVHDVAVPLSAAEATAAALPLARLERLAVAGHIGWMGERTRIIESLMAA